MLTALSAPLLSFDVGLVREYLFRDIVIEAARRTLVISVIAQALGVLLGILAAVARNLKIPVASSSPYRSSRRATLTSDRSPITTAGFSSRPSRRR